MEHSAVEKNKGPHNSQSLQLKLEDALQENELLLLQLMQAQEELVEYFEEKNKFEKLYHAYLARWDRLEKRFPNYLDFGDVALIGFDNLSEVPSLTWQVKDFAQSGLALDAFFFQTILQDGQPGIAIISEASASNEQATDPKQALVPASIKPKSAQLETFMSIPRGAYKQILAACTILAQLEASNWQDLALPKDLDINFWHPFLKLLCEQVKALPKMLRFDEVKLKRELINVDYEHLWIELKGLELAERFWPKFEMRLGAALVQESGFSQFPKFEFPMLNGKTKPFESWYAESHDDAGAKLELRFSLEKSVFDTAVLNKLSDPDKALLVRLILTTPGILKRLQTNGVAIHRPWATWIDFAQGAARVLESNRVAAQSLSKPAVASASTPVVEPVTDVSTPSRDTDKAKGVKVISFSASKKNVLPATLATKPKPTTKKPTAIANSKKAINKK